jgi:hypothetical protein
MIAELPKTVVVFHEMLEVTVGGVGYVLWQSDNDVGQVPSRCWSWRRQRSGVATVSFL